MINILTMWKLEKVFLILAAVFLSSGKANGARNDALNFKDVSKKCYFCLGQEKDVDNIAACSTDNNLDVEECPLEDLFDKCVVVQAFSLSKNTTIFKRECTSRRLCEERRICSDPDFSDCRYECCTGDLCNSFGFTDDIDVRPKIPQPTVAGTTRKYQELVPSESVENVVTGNVKQTTVVPEVTTQGGSTGEPPITRQSSSTTSNTNQEKPQEIVPVVEEEKRQEIVPVVEEGCEDLDSFCPTYVTNPSHWPMFCKDNDKYTSIACRKTCKFCISRYEVEAAKKLTTQRPRGTPTLEDCKDQLSNCQELKALNYCRLMAEHMKSECGKTCGFCSSEPIGTGITVTEKVMTSESVVTETTMKPSKGKPVNTDFPDSVVTETTMEPSTAKPINTDLPTTSTRDETTSERAETTSPTASGQVQSGVKAPPTLEGCQDRGDNCVKLEAMDYCRLMTAFMATNCRKTCGLCSNDTPEPKTTEKSTHLPSTHVTSEKLTESSPEPTTVMTSSSMSASTSQLTTLVATTEKTLKPRTSSTAEPMPQRTSQIPSESNVIPPFKQTQPPNKSCVDKRHRCAEFAKREGYCDYHHDFMQRNCPKSCGFCSPGVAGGPTSRVVKTSQPTPSEEMITTVTKLPTNPETTSKRTDRITTNPTITELHATENITTSPTTSGEVQSGVTFQPTSENDDCQDKRDTCVSLKAMDYCRLIASFMENNCRRTCGLCTKGGTSGSVSNTTKPVTTLPLVETTPEPKLPAGPDAFTSDLLPEVTTKPSVVTSELNPEVTSHKTTSKPTPEITSPITTPEVTPNITSRSAPVVTTEPSAGPTSKTLSPTTSATTTQLTTLEPTSEPKMSTSKTTVKPQPTSNVTIVTKDCYDKRKECAKFAKYPGYCFYTRKFMIKNCPKSCGFCTDGGTSGGSASNTTKPVITLPLVETTPEPKFPAGPDVITSDLLPEVTTKPSVVTSELTPEVTSHKTTSEPTPEITSLITTPEVTPNITSRPASVVTTEPSPGSTSKTHTKHNFTTSISGYDRTFCWVDLKNIVTDYVTNYWVDLKNIVTDYVTNYVTNYVTSYDTTFCRADHNDRTSYRADHNDRTSYRADHNDRTSYRADLKSIALKQRR
ncbi:Hypothetical predicted protein [Paramuricea clavata]|uniref:Uncharacterized protein n=1 Tax=Paramuricea clavata TaxID=317549 RepID=A0A6S7GPP4_PARCT|nr:Hypothetical predicted protein [Paramuricea clavata]